MSDPGNAYERAGIVNGVDHSPIAHTDAPLVSVSPELLASCGPGILSKSQNPAVNSAKQRIVQRIEFLLSRRFHFKGVFRAFSQLL
jgi:hypothetical protein